MRTSSQQLRSDPNLDLELGCNWHQLCPRSRTQGPGRFRVRILPSHAGGPHTRAPANHLNAGYTGVLDVHTFFLRVRELDSREFRIRLLLFLDRDERWKPEGVECSLYKYVAYTVHRCIDKFQRIMASGAAKGDQKQ